MAATLKHAPEFMKLAGEVPGAAGVWQSQMEKAFPELRVTALGDTRFSGRFRSAGREDFQISDIHASPHLVERHPGVASAKNYDYFKVSLQLSGTGEMVQGDRQFKLLPGMLTVYDTSRPYDLRFDEQSHFLVAMFPKHVLDIPQGLASELSASPLDCTTGVGAIMSDYLCGLSENLTQFTGLSGERLARTGLNLLSTLLAAEEERFLTPSDSQRQSLLVEICFFINKHLTNPNLDPGFVAAAHFVSTRQLYNLFAETGVSVAQWIKQRRLSECKRQLSDPMLAHESVTTIARRWTFDEAPYFSRIFKETYGVTPSQWRQQALFAEEKFSSP